MSGADFVRRAAAHYSLTANEQKKLAAQFNALKKWAENPSGIFSVAGDSVDAQFLKPYLREVLSDEDTLNDMAWVLERVSPAGLVDLLVAYLKKIVEKQVRTTYMRASDYPVVVEALRQDPKIKKLKVGAVIALFVRTRDKLGLTNDELFRKVAAISGKYEGENVMDATKAALNEIEVEAEAERERENAERRREKAASVIQGRTREFLYTPGMAGYSRAESQSGELFGTLKGECAKNTIEALRNRAMQLSPEQQFAMLLKYSGRHHMEPPNLEPLMKRLSGRMTKLELCEALDISNV